MALDMSSENLESPMDLGLPPSCTSDSGQGNTIVEELDEAAQQKLAVIQ